MIFQVHFTLGYNQNNESDFICLVLNKYIVIF